MRRRRLTKWAKWACTAAALVAVGAAVFSRFYRFYLEVVPRDHRWDLRVIELQGLLSVIYSSGVSPRANGWADHVIVERFDGWDWGLSSGDASLRGPWPWHAGLVWGDGPTDRELGVSVIYPVLLTTLPAALLWYVDCRRSRAGLCANCGYDRRGLAVGVACPECGTGSSVLPESP